MAGFIRVGVAVLTKAKPLIVETIKQSPRVAKVPVKSVIDYSKALVKGRVTMKPIGGYSQGYQGTINVSTRAGLQSRQLAIYAAKTAVVKGPVTAVKLTIGAGKLVVKEALVLPNYAINHFRLFRLDRVRRGGTSLLERGGDKAVNNILRLQDYLGLRPSFAGNIGLIARGAVITTIYKGVGYVEDKADAIAKYSQEAAATYKSLSSRFKSLRAGGVPDNPPEPIPATRPPLVPVAPASAPDRVVRPNNAPPTSPARQNPVILRPRNVVPGGGR